MIVYHGTVDAYLPSIEKEGPDDKSVDSMDAFWTPATIPSSCIKAVLYPKRKVEYWHGSH